MMPMEKVTVSLPVHYVKAIDDYVMHARHHDPAMSRARLIREMVAKHIRPRRSEPQQPRRSPGAIC
jgi:metal-responsive CopG/Arc/MetJ family transcriptional regulator